MKARKTSRNEEWLAAALSDTLTLLSDHAHCEKKAAASAISLIARFWKKPRLVQEMGELAEEEMGHFNEVHALLVARGGVLGADDGDPYAKALVKQARGETGDERMVDRLLIGALIEARSFERLQLLGEHHPDDELREMFARLAVSEARHGAQFVALARDLGPSREYADARLAELADFEWELIEHGPIRCAMH